MNSTEQFQALRQNGESIDSLFAGVSPDQATWRPAPDRWSLLEILNHLCDEEREDFRLRIGLVLEDPGLTWPPIDPEAAAQDRDYNSRDLAESLRDFRKERAASMEWLEGLTEPDWNAEYPHPKLGAIRAGDLLVSWVAHDLLHIRQIAGTRVAQLAEQAQPFSISYAAP